MSEKLYPRDFNDLKSDLAILNKIKASQMLYNRVITKQMAQKLYKYCWGNNEKRITMKNRLCKVLARGKMNSILIEFLDNKQREITSRYAVRKISHLQ